MKIQILAFLLFLASISISTAQNNKTMSFFDFNYTDINGKIEKLSDLKGKYILAVNVASECGYTKQYTQLQELYDHYKDKLVVIGFPCNQFGGQEPGTEKEILSFCQKNYGVNFPLSEKISVKGDQQAPIYKWLTTQPLKNETEHTIKWNFHKFLIDPNGKLIGSFPSAVTPLDEQITSLIQ